MDTQRLEYLFGEHESNRITVPEKTELYDFLSDFENKEDVLDFFEAAIRKTPEETSHDNNKWSPIIEKILATSPLAATVIPVRKLFPWRQVAAAAIILILLAGGYLYFNKSSHQQAKTDKELAIKKDVEAPKGTKAMITLANGQNILLDSIANGTLATQSNVNVIKTADGKIVYSALSFAKVQGDIQYNTLTNPRGSNVVDITLMDGSRVWLNAGSSVTYPVAFAGDERKVQVTGEAYFEVAHNAAMPFVVQKNDVSVQVLGTHFNVNTYDDEAEIKITLLEGSVKVLRKAQDGKGSISKVIKPGEQALLPFDGVQGKLAQGKQDDNLIKVQTINPDEVMAWKNGVFVFRNTNIGTIMRQVARWYDVEIIYNGNFTDVDFGGTMSRKANVSELLKRLEATEAVHFTIEGRKIIVTH